LAVLADAELLDADGLKRLKAADTNKDKVIDFAEFASFFASEFLRNVPVSTADAASASSKVAGGKPAAAAAAAPAADAKATVSPKGKSAADIEAVPLPSKWQLSLPPIIVRLSCRSSLIGGADG
jgi:hypothetical protein